MNKLSREKQIEIVKCLTEGMSLRSTARVCDVARNTVSKLLLELGYRCERYHDKHVVNLQSKRIQCDEIWSFVGKKQRNVPREEKAFGVGSVWTWTAIDADSKLIVSWALGNRDYQSARLLIGDVQQRISNRIQLTTDGHKAYLEAVDVANFEEGIDYAQLIKVYAPSPDGDTRYSPSEVIETKKVVYSGSPDPVHISTSYVERSNLTMRMSMRRFTRLTNAFSKKIEYHAAALALYFINYNFVAIHRTLGCSPAMAAGVSKKLWDAGDIVDLLR